MPAESPLNEIALKEASRRVQAAADQLGLAITVHQLTQPTRTAEEAAEACGSDVAQIVKSLIFRGARTGKPYLLLVSGKNRVNEKAVAKDIGEKLKRPDAGYVRDLTGYAIGGIPPFGHREAIPTYMDSDLVAHDIVWAAAGTPNSLFSVAPAALRDATGAVEIGVRE